MKRLFCTLLLLFSFALAWADDKTPYNEAANAQVEIQTALKAAHDGNKLALIVFGANWCGDCRVLDSEMHKGDLARLMSDKFVVVKVDVGRFDRNKDITAQYGNPTEKGIPSVVLLNTEGKAIYKTDGGELADARKMGAQEIGRFFAAMAEKAKN
jgi:thioredoxin 1